MADSYWALWHEVMIPERSYPYRAEYGIRHRTHETTKLASPPSKKTIQLEIPFRVGTERIGLCARDRADSEQIVAVTMMLRDIAGEKCRINGGDQIEFFTGPSRGHERRFRLREAKRT